jgi:hypothetical protein
MCIVQIHLLFKICQVIHFKWVYIIDKLKIMSKVFYKLLILKILIYNHSFEFDHYKLFKFSNFDSARSYQFSFFVLHPKVSPQVIKLFLSYKCIYPLVKPVLCDIPREH